MASAGRILIMPKGNYDSNVTYEMLDLVFHGGASWVAKKTVVGIEPTDATTEHWMKMCDSVDLTEINNRLTELENRAVVDLTPYALATDVATVSGEVDALENVVAGLSQTISGLSLSLAEVEENANQPTSKMAIVTYNGSNTYNNAGDPAKVTFDFAPKVIIMLGWISTKGSAIVQTNMETGEYKYNCSKIFCDRLSSDGYTENAGFMYGGDGSEPTRYAKKSADGKTIYWYNTTSHPIYNCNVKEYTYYVLGIA